MAKGLDKKEGIEEKSCRYNSIDNIQRVNVKCSLTSECRIGLSLRCCAKGSVVVFERQQLQEQTVDL